MRLGIVPITSDLLGYALAFGYELREAAAAVRFRREADMSRPRVPYHSVANETHSGHRAIWSFIKSRTAGRRTVKD